MFTVAGGRSRLHLIDLGNSERGKTNGGIPLSGLGNILLAIFNGQRHLPYRDHNLTHVLKECLGSLTCHTAMIVHVSPTVQNYSDTLTTLQLASRIHRLRRRKIKYSSNNNAGSGGSSGEDASKPSSSEPDPSSSDLSADTVIYVGPLDDQTDGEHPPVYIPHINSGDNRCVLSKALRGSAAEQKHKSSLSKVIEEKSPVHKLHFSPKSSPLKTAMHTGHTPKSSPVHSVTSKSTPVKKACPKITDDVKSNSDEQWIDGPRISKSKLVEARHIIKETQSNKRETWIDGPMQETKMPIQFESVPMPANPIPLQVGVLNSHGNDNIGYGYMDNHKKNMIRKWVENQTSQIHKSRHNSPSHKSQSSHKDSGQRQSDITEITHKMEPITKDSTRRINVEESTIRTGLKAGSKGMAIEEENFGPPNSDHSLTPKKACSSKQSAKNEIDEDDDSEELAEIPPALPLIQPSSLSSREVSMESLDSKYKERLRMDDELVSNRSRDIDLHGMSRCPIDDEDEILEIIEVEESYELVPMQDSCLQVTEEDIAFCMGLSENPLPEVDQEDSEDHPLRILSQENLTVASTFTDTLSLYSEVERQIRNEAYLRQTIGFYVENYNCELGDLNPHESLPSSISRLDEIMGLTDLYGSRRILDSNDMSTSRIAPQFQSLSLSNVRDTEEFHGDGSVYSEPAYRPSDKICDSCKRTMSRPGSAVGECDAYHDLEVAQNDSYGPFERYRGNDITDARIASLRHPDGASDPNLREERRVPGNGAPSASFRELKSNLHLEVTPPVVTNEPRSEKNEKCDKIVARVAASSKPDGYDSGHESTPRTGKHSPAATSRRAESGYDSVPRDSDASSLDSYPTRRAAVARAHAKKHTTAKYKQHSDRSFCSWLRNPFTCKYADTDPEISDF